MSQESGSSQSLKESLRAWRSVVREIRRLLRPSPGLMYLLTLVAFGLILPLASEPFDLAVSVQHAQWFYYGSVNPVYFWGQGSFTAIINAGAFAPDVGFGALGFQSVLLQQFFVKLPILLTFALSGLLIGDILRRCQVKDSLANLASITWMTNLVGFYVVGVAGSLIAVSVFFLVLTLWLWVRKHWFFAGIALGVAAGTYLFPALLIPALALSVGRKFGRLQAVAFTAISVATTALGQLPSLALTVSYPMPGTSGAPLLGGPSLLSSNGYPPGFFSIYDFVYLIGRPFLFSGLTLLSILILAVFAVNVPFIMFPEIRGNTTPLIRVFCLAGIFFAVFNPDGAPQYFLAAVPFIILLAFLERNWVLLPLLSVGALLGAITLLTWNPSALFSYFQSVAPSLQSYKQTFPLHTVYWASVSYTVTLLVLAYVAVHIPQRELQNRSSRIVHLVERVWPPVITRPIRQHIRNNTLVIAGTLAAVAVIVLPAMSQVPTNMPNDDSINTWLLSPGEPTASGQTTNFSYHLPGLYTLLDSAGKSAFSARLNISSLPDQIYQWFALNETFEYNTTLYLSQRLTLGSTYSNLTLVIQTMGNSQNTTVVELCHSPSMPSCDPLLVLSGSSARATYTAGGGRTLTFETNATVGQGVYFVMLFGTTTLPDYALGSSDFPRESGIQPVYLNGRPSPNSTLALSAGGIPRPDIFVDALPVAEVRNNSATVPDVVYRWYALNQTYDVNESSYLAQLVEFNFSLTSFNITFQGYLNTYNSTMVSLCENLPPQPCDGVLVGNSNQGKVVYTPAHGQTITVSSAQPVNAGNYYFVLQGTSSLTSYAEGSKDFPAYSDAGPVIVNGTLIENETLALTVEGLTVSERYFPYSGYLLDIPPRALSSIVVVSLGTNVNLTSSEYPTLMTTLPYVSYSSLWQSHLGLLAGGFIGWLAMVGTTVWAIVRMWPKTLGRNG